MSDLRHSGWLASIRRLRLIGRQSIEEALRLRLSGLLMAVAAMGLLGSYGLREFNFGLAELAFLGDVGLGVIGLAGIFLAVLLTAHLFLDDLSAGAAACVLVRPIRRWEFVVGKMAGVAGALALFTAVLGALFGGLLFWRSQQLGVPPAALSVFLGSCALLWMKFTLVAAMTMCVSVYAGSVIFAACTGLLLVVIGHLRPFANGGLEWLRVWPNLTLFDAPGLLSSGQPLAGTQMVHLLSYWAVCCGWLLALASYVFRRREF